MIDTSSTQSTSQDTDASNAEATMKLQALNYHAQPTHGKFSIMPTKAMDTQHDLSLAYSPGVAEPCLEIAKNPELAYKYTNKGNMVACISNGTAVLGLGNIGALASKPVMEGKSVLFKKFAGVDCIDLCVDAPEKTQFINIVKCLAPSFGGINLEDIKGPDCFEIEEKLKEIMPIPIFHDDQHGTAIICLAGLWNALEISGKSISEIKIICNGAGAAGIACMNLIVKAGASRNNIFVCDTKGVIWPERKSGMNEFKLSLANKTITQDTSLEDISDGADVLIGVSAANVFTEKIVRSMKKDPVIFAMANPNPEIIPTLAKKYRPDCIIATGRSDYANQINNVMCFPFLFRAALDTRSSQINEEMKMAAAKAIAALAKEEVPEVVKKAMPGREFIFGRDYVVPTPFDPRLMERIAVSVAEAAAESGVAKTPINDYEVYKQLLEDMMKSAK
eukprot:CAMPEP_0194279554 /NCGR_PEP_ID=MMETSP0169-20130528/13993_1 /TAXON_ID=218684 /ORGANISM="Corethron pennatum, Strain L29A3" /LENGTH=447 /DNA_ID=CAMNT_0039023993 /DNA_START=123 /DNA_END=1466 /DNA_ORIENTATION=-